MTKLYLVKDGIKNVGCLIKNEKQFFNTNFYLLTYDFKTNEGYIDKKGQNYWRLYTQVGQKYGQSRYNELPSFKECINRLKELNGNNEVYICKATDIEKYK
jgi:hypothetical protein